MWSVGRGPRGGSAGEVPVCFRGVCEEPVSQPAKPLWKVAAPPAFPPHRLLLCHRAAVFCASGGEDPNRNADQGHVAVWQQLQLALHVHSVGAAEDRMGHTSQVIATSTKHVCFSGTELPGVIYKVKKKKKKERKGKKA